MHDREKKAVIAMMTPEAPGDVPTITIGIPNGCEQDMNVGRQTQTVDLTKLGIPVKLMLYRAASHEECAAVIRDAADSMGAPFTDLRRNRDRDLGIDEPVKH